MPKVTGVFCHYRLFEFKFSAASEKPKSADKQSVLTITSDSSNSISSLDIPIDNNKQNQPVQQNQQGPQNQPVQQNHQAQIIQQTPQVPSQEGCLAKFWQSKIL
jgi:hypothetical protein